MSRSCRVEMRTEEVRHPVWTVTCDGCGTAVNPVDCAPEDMIHELVVCLDQDECMSTRVRRDYCGSCLDPRWAVLCASVIDIDDDATGTIGLRPCCATEPDGGHRGTCPNSFMMGGTGI